jgi:hypothetical protein
MVGKEIIDPNFSHLIAKRTVVFGGHAFRNSLEYEKCRRLNHVVQKEDESGFSIAAFVIAFAISHL